MRLAVISTHPVQYNAPWFRFIARRCPFALKVYYLWDFGVTPQIDAKFRRDVRWDVPLLSGYDHEFVPNVSARPGTDRFFGLRNPSLVERVRDYSPTAVLFIGYNYESFFRFLWRWDVHSVPVLLRGDSHRLLPRQWLRERLSRRVVSSVFQRFSGFLFVGAANRAYFRYHGVPESRLFYAPHAVDNGRFTKRREDAARDAASWKKELGIPQHHRVVLFAGKLTPVKRPLDLLRAFVQADLPDVTLLFVGSGPMEDGLRRQAARSSNIRFAPFQNQSMMPRTYAAGDVFVLPSFSETWGLVVNEAMCLSRPIIASTHVGCAADLVHPHRNGLVFPAGDVQALADCLKEALSDPRRLQSWGEESRRIIDSFSYEQTTIGLLDALAYVVPTNGSTTARTA